MTEMGGITIAPPAEQNSLIDAIVQSDLPIVSPEESQAQEKQYEETQQLLSQPWFVTNWQGPAVFCRWIGTGWDVVIKDDDHQLTPRQKNVLQRAIEAKLTRHGRQQVREHHLDVRKTQAEKDAEVRAALRDSFESGNLTGV